MRKSRPRKLADQTQHEAVRTSGGHASRPGRRPVCGQSDPGEPPVEVIYGQDAHDGQCQRHPDQNDPPEVAADDNENQRVFDNGMRQAKRDRDQGGVFAAQLSRLGQPVEDGRPVSDSDKQADQPMAPSPGRSIPSRQRDPPTSFFPWPKKRAKTIIRRRK